MTIRSPRRLATSKRRRAILDAALSCFLKSGFDAATIEHIRDASGASFGSIYHHFGSKQAIAAALYVEGLQDVDQALQRAREAHDNVRDGLKAQVRGYFEWLQSHRDMALYIFRISTADQAGRAAEQIDEVNRRSQKALADWLRPFVERGEVVRMPDDLYDTVVYGPCSHFARHWLAGREDLNIEDVVEHLSESIIRSLCVANSSCSDSMVF
jgi:AcrR family transcriptional regulator